MFSFFGPLSFAGGVANMPLEIVPDEKDK